MRIKVTDSTMDFNDIYQGLQHFVLRHGVDDFVLRRGDGMYAYNLAVVLDDIAMGITEIIRGTIYWKLRLNKCICTARYMLSLLAMAMHRCS